MENNNIPTPPKEKEGLTAEEMLNEHYKKLNWWKDISHFKRISPEIYEATISAMEAYASQSLGIENLLTKEPVHFLLSNALRYCNEEQMRALAEKLQVRCVSQSPAEVNERLYDILADDIRAGLDRVLRDSGNSSEVTHNAIVQVLEDLKGKYAFAVPVTEKKTVYEKVNVEDSDFQVRVYNSKKKVHEDIWLRETTVEVLTQSPNDKERMKYAEAQIAEIKDLFFTLTDCLCGVKLSNRQGDALNDLKEYLQSLNK